MKDYLEGCNKYLKYDNCILVEHEDEESKCAKGENFVKDKNIVRVIQEIRKNLRSNVLYKNDRKNVLFNEPLYNVFPLKCLKDKKMDQISYVCRVTSEEDANFCLKKIQDIVSKMYVKNMLIDKDFLEDLLSVFMELCRQVSVACFQRGSLLRQLFNYNVMLLFHYQKLVRSSLSFNLKKEIKRRNTMSELRKEIDIKKETINSLKSEILETDQLIGEERKNAEREISEVSQLRRSLYLCSALSPLFYFPMPYNPRIIYHALQPTYHLPCLTTHVSSTMYHVSSTMYHVSSTMYHVSSTMYHVSSTMYHLSNLVPPLPGEHKLSEQNRQA